MFVMLDAAAWGLWAMTHCWLLLPCILSLFLSLCKAGRNVLAQMCVTQAASQLATHSSFQAHTRSSNASRPRLALDEPSASKHFSTTFCSSTDMAQCEQANANLSQQQANAVLSHQQQVLVQTRHITWPHLCCNTSMVSAWQPQRLLACHTGIASHHVLPHSTAQHKPAWCGASIKRYSTAVALCHSRALCQACQRSKHVCFKGTLQWAAINGEFAPQGSNPCSI